MQLETEAAHRGAPRPTRGFPGGRQEWTPQSGLTSNIQPAVSPHSPKGSVPGAQGERLLALGSLSSITTHSHPHKHISEGMDRPVTLSPCHSTSARENVFQKRSLQNYFQLQPTSVGKPSVVGNCIPVLGLGIPHESGHCQGEAVPSAPSISCQDKDLHIQRLIKREGSA